MCDINKRSIDDYVILKTLGSGGFGSTYLVKKNGDTSNKQYVLKHVYVTPAKLSNSCHEINILKKIAKYGCKPNLLCFVDYFINPNDSSINFITDAFENSMTLDKFIKQLQKARTFLSEGELLKIMKGCMQALVYLHKIGIAHSDIKPENILINNNLDIQLIDFGISCSKRCRPSGTILYSSPELIKILGTKKTVSVETLKLSDVFSMGLVFYLLANLEFPFHINGKNSYLYDYPLSTDSNDSNNSNTNSEESEKSDKPMYEIVDNLDVKIDNPLSLAVSLDRFYKERGHAILSLYKFNSSKIAEMINNFIQSMMIVPTKSKNSRQSSHRLIRDLQKIIVQYQSLSTLNISVSPIKESYLKSPAE